MVAAKTEINLLDQPIVKQKFRNNYIMEKRKKKLKLLERS